MTDEQRKHRARRELDPVADTVDVPADQARRAARVVAAYATDPDDARELLGMLGLFPPPRPREEEPPAARPAFDPGAPSKPLVSTAAAAAALRTTLSTLHRFTDARIVTPARVDPDGTPWWNLADLRRQVDAYLGESIGDKPPFG